MIQSPDELESAYQAIQDIGQNPSDPEQAARRKQLLAEIKEYEENQKRADEAARPNRPVDE